MLAKPEPGGGISVPSMHNMVDCLGGKPGQGGRRDAPVHPASLCKQHSPRRVPSSLVIVRRFPFALCLFYHFFAASHKTIPPSLLPPTNYSFKVVFHSFRDFHSVPVKREMCSNWNILYIQPQNHLNVPVGTQRRLPHLPAQFRGRLAYSDLTWLHARHSISWQS